MRLSEKINGSLSSDFDKLITTKLEEAAQLKEERKYRNPASDPKEEDKFIHTKKLNPDGTEIEEPKEEVKESEELNEKYVETFGGDTEDFINEVNAIKAKLEEIDTDSFAAKLAQQMVWDWIETCDRQIERATRLQSGNEFQTESEKTKIEECDEVKESDDFEETKKVLAIEPGSDEEAQLDNIYNTDYDLVWDELDDEEQAEYTKVAKTIRKLGPGEALIDVIDELNDKAKANGLKEDILIYKYLEQFNSKKVKESEEVNEETLNETDATPEFLEDLKNLINNHLRVGSIADLKIEEENGNDILVATFKDGATKRIDVTADSNLALIGDFLKDLA